MKNECRECYFLVDARSILTEFEGSSESGFPLFELPRSNENPNKTQGKYGARKLRRPKKFILMKKMNENGDIEIKSNLISGFLRLQT